MNLPELKKPFDPSAISWRVGSTTKDKSKGMALAYIDARDVQDRLDAVCGVDGWQCRYVPTHDKKTICEIGIFSDMRNDWIWKSDGAGDSDVEAEKGALSDAFKRAAVRWGIGRYLYDLESPWVELDTYERDGKAFVKGIKPAEYAKLRALLAKDIPDSRPEAQARPAPPKTIAADINEATLKARKWADDAMAAIKKMDVKALSTWEMENGKIIVRLKDIDPDKHRQLLAVMQECDGLVSA